MAISKIAVELNLQPRVAIAASQTFVDGEIAGVVLLCRCAAVEVDIAHIVLIAQHGSGVDVPVAGRVERCVEHQSSVDVPLTVDILRLRSASAGRRVVGHHIADAVARGVESHPCGPHLLVVVHIVIVVEQAQRLGEGGLQARITLGDVERVTIVGDVEQVGH